MSKRQDFSWYLAGTYIKSEDVPLVISLTLSQELYLESFHLFLSDKTHEKVIQHSSYSCNHGGIPKWTRRKTRVEKINPTVLFTVWENQ